MTDFTYSIPTTVHFGKGQLFHLADMTESGKHALLVYGGGSIKRSGLYDAVLEVLTKAGITVTELPGVEPNPRIESVRRGVALCKDNHIDMVLAVGGGSTIDCAKVVAAGARYAGDAWDLVLDGSKITDALPIYVVLTIAATGSEMDPNAVISDMSKNEKWGTASPFMVPTMSVLDPTYTYSVSSTQVSAGTADIMSHTLETYFTSIPGATLQAHMCEAVLKTLIQYGPVALAEPENYDARANLMWCSSLAINGILRLGARIPWCVHPMEHELSAFYDITHGQGLAILTPVWMRYVMEKDPSRIPQFAAYGRSVFDIREPDDRAAADAAVETTADFLFNKLGLPSTLRAVGITEKINFPVMAKKAARVCVGCYVPLTPEDITEIYERAF